MVELKGITHSYGDHRVLDQVSLSVRLDSRLALMGPSGCGKTTLLRILLGLERPDAGTVDNTFGTVAAVFQEPRLLPWRTALQNVNLVLGDHPGTLEKARQWLCRMELMSAEEKYPRELSGGMQQRVSLARALAAEPDLLVLDEPFKGLDEALRDRILARVAETNAAILLVTHDRREAEALGCEIVNME